MIKLFWVWEEEFKELNSEIEQDWNNESEHGQIALDIIENNYEIIIIAPIAWVDFDDIDVSLNNSVITISWFRKKPDFYNDNENILRNNECFWWKFLRNIILPDNMDFDTIKASMENNLLVISIQKLKFNSKNIKIDRIEGN